ncbi:MAG: DsbA family protein [Desulfobacterales bacterium]|nr:DsbA family protein [Desulfobacterales bacterium]
MPFEPHPPHRRGGAEEGGRAARQGREARPGLPRRGLRRQPRRGARRRPAAAPPWRRPANRGVCAPTTRSRAARRAPVTVVVFSDFQCPFCAGVEPTLKQVEQAYGAQGRASPGSTSRSPSTPNAHAGRRGGRGGAASRASSGRCTTRCSRPSRTSRRAAYERWARELGLDLAAFEAAAGLAASSRRASRRTTRWRRRLGIDGTPTLVINGEQVVGAQPFESRSRRSSTGSWRRK